MLQHDEDIITVVDNAFKAGFYMPKYYFQKDIDEVNKVKNCCEIIYNHPMFFVKPKGIEFSYIIYWNGSRFKGGFVSINNNYTGLQRGGFDRNGETLFASHIREIKMCYKKFTENDIPKWIVHSFILTEEGKILYWGLDNIEHYKEIISNYTGELFEDLVELYLSSDKRNRPEGFISSLMIYDSVGKKSYIHTGIVHMTISSAWKDIYNKINDLRKEFNYTLCLDTYARKGYAMLKSYNKLT